MKSYVMQLRFVDLDEAVAFYTEKLGCELAFRYEDFYAGVLVGEQMLHLKLVDQPDSNLDAIRDGDHLHLTLSVEDLPAKREALLKNGVEVSPIRDQPWGLECTVCDPQGHTLFVSQFQADD